MIHFILYVLIGSAISYLMQSQITWLAEHLTPHKWAQILLKIVFDALLSVTWIVGAPALFALKIYLERKENEAD